MSPKDEVALKEAFNPQIGTAFIKYFAGNRELSIMKNDEGYGFPIILNFGK